MANEERVIWEGDIQISLVAEIESSFFFARLYRRFFCFRFLSLFSCSGDFLPNNFSSIFNISKRRARKRFNPCERSLSALTMIPVGMCLICTHVDVLLTFCPPGPPERIKVSSMSSSRRPSSRIRFKSLASFSIRTPNLLIAINNTECIEDKK